MFFHYGFGEYVKKLVKISLIFGLLLNILQSSAVFASEKPSLLSFTMSPDSVDVVTSNNVVTFDLTVTNPTGIQTSKVLVKLSDGGSNSTSTYLSRTDSPEVSSLEKVTFHGSLTIPANFPSGAYFASAAPVVALNSNGSAGYSSDVFTATTTSKLVGAENALLVRSGGSLNFNYTTFVGPTFNKSLSSSFTNSKFSNVIDPIWKVGEVFNPSDYYELKIPSLSLKLLSNSPGVCTSDGSLLKLISVGSCSFTVFTDKTSDYQYQKDVQTVNITAARTKPTYTVGSVSTQSSSVLPLAIPLPYVFGPFGYLTPITTTPNVCSAVVGYVNIISGGTCTLNYSSPASADYLASDVFPLTFQITRSPQSIIFSLPTSASLASKVLALSAKASSGLAVTFNSTTPAICSVTESSLNLLASGSCQVAAQQGGSATISPVSIVQSVTVTGLLLSEAKSKTVKKIVCLKNGKSRAFAGGKCPSGYKIKK